MALNYYGIAPLVGNLVCFILCIVAVSSLANVSDQTGIDIDYGKVLFVGIPAILGYIIAAMGCLLFVCKGWNKWIIAVAAFVAVLCNSVLVLGAYMAYQNAQNRSASVRASNESSGVLADAQTALGTSIAALIVGLLSLCSLPCTKREEEAVQQPLLERV